MEEGGSLTILATALVDTGSKMDEVIFEEFKGTGNLEIVLDRKLVDRRVWPAIDINRSGTRREEMLMDPEEHRRVCVMRRVLSDMNAPDAMELLVTRLQKTKTQRRVLDEHEHERLMYGCPRRFAGCPMPNMFEATATGPRTAALRSSSRATTRRSPKTAGGRCRDAHGARRAGRGDRCGPRAGGLGDPAGGAADGPRAASIAP